MIQSANRAEPGNATAAAAEAQEAVGAVRFSTKNNDFRLNMMISF